MMKRFMGAVLAAALAVSSPGLGSYQAFAQSVVLEIPAGVGQTLGGAGVAGAAGGAPLFQAPAGFDNPGFFVLGALGVQLQQLAPQASDPAAYARSLDLLLQSRAVQADPGSPLAVAARIQARALLEPGSLGPLSFALKSVQPGLGESVAAQLQDAVRQVRESPGGDPAAFESLRRTAEGLDRIGGDGPGGAPSGELIERLYLGPLERSEGGGEAALPTAPGVQAVSFQQPFLALRLPDGEARLQPAQTPSPEAARGSTLKKLPVVQDLPAKVKVADVREAAADLRRRSARDPHFDVLVRQLSQLYPDLMAAGLAPERTFLVPREPELLELLKLGPEDAGAVRILHDGRRSLGLLIVTVPKNGITRAALAEVLIHEAIHASDQGIFKVPASEVLMHQLIEGYTQKRTQDRLFKARGLLDLGDEPNSRYVHELRLAESLIQAAGEEPLRALVKLGTDSVLEEAFGRRWTFMRLLSRAAREEGLALERYAPVLSRIMHKASFSEKDFMDELVRLFPGSVTALTGALESLSDPGPGGARGALRAVSRTLDRWAAPFRPDHGGGQVPLRRKLGQATRFFVGFNAAYNSLLLASAWALGGLVLSFALPPAVPLAAAVIALARAPFTAAAEETLFRMGINQWLERGSVRLGLSPRKAALAGAVLGSTIFAAAHVLSQGLDPVNLAMKFVAGLAFTRIFKKYGLGAAILTHALWNASMALALAIPLLTPVYILLPLFFILPGLIQGRLERSSADAFHS